MDARHPSRVAAFFDVDGTLTRTNVVQPYMQFQLARRAGLGKAVWLLALLLKVPYYLWLDRRSRVRFIEVFYRSYTGLPVGQVSRFAHETFEQHVLPRLFPGARDCLEQHRAQGHRLVLVTGGLDVWVEPLALYLRVDDALSMRLPQRDGHFTGELGEPPLIAGEKACRMREYAAVHGVDLAESYAYADSISDLPMLELVGHPVAVQADRELRRVAGEREWRVVEW